MKFNNYDKIKCVVFDLDGTIYFGKELAEKANEVVQAARQKFQNVFFITNNSNQSRTQVHERIQGFQINAELKEVINTSYALAKYLSDNEYKKVYCLGTNALAEEISSFEIITDSKFPQAIVIGYDKDFNLMKLENAINVFHKNCKIIVASKERTYPRTPEIMSPGAGPLAAAFEHAVNKDCDMVIGKPNSFMLDLMTQNLNLKPEEILVVGDSYEIDVQMAKNYGAEAILINNNGKIHKDCVTVKELKDILDLWGNFDCLINS